MLSLSRRDAKSLRHLLAKLDVSGGELACHPYMGTRDEDGYGRIRRGKLVLGAHREMYRLTTGADLGEWRVCHTCDNPPCCNPLHLFLGTVADNNHDRDVKGRHGITPGIQHWNVALTESEVRDIFAARQRGVRGADLAARYGISQATISVILHGHRWAHLRLLEAE